MERRLLLLSELMRARNGHGWIEFNPDFEDQSAVHDPDDNLMEIVWMEGATMMRDCYGAISYGDFDAEQRLQYLKDWRVWTEKPTLEQRNMTPWEKEAGICRG